MSEWRVLLILLAGFAIVTGWVAIDGSFPGDSAVVAGLSGSFERPMLLVRRLSDTVVLMAVAVAAIALLLRSGRRLDAMCFGVGVAVVWAANPLLKEVFDRPRPDVALSTETVSAYGFPSGHAAGTAALLGALLMVLRSRRIWVLVLGGVLLAVVAFAQLAIGVHYPSDILAGWLWAAAWITAVSWFRRVRTLG